MKASFQNIPFFGGNVMGFQRSPMNAKKLMLLPAQQPSSSADKTAAVYSKRTQIGEAMKEKLRLGAKILRAGGTMGKVLKHLFTTSKIDEEAGEKLLKSSHCCLSTTAGPIAGLLFISTHKIAFCSDKPIKLSSSSSPNGPNGEQLMRVHYKVVIPLSKINRVNQSEDVKKPSHKYIQIVTVDNFDFWFMGFFNYQKAHKYLQQALISIRDS